MVKDFWSPLLLSPSSAPSPLSQRPVCLHCAGVVTVPGVLALSASELERSQCPAPHFTDEIIETQGGKRLVKAPKPVWHCQGEALPSSPIPPTPHTERGSVVWQDYTRVVCPVIDIINLDSFSYIESATELRGGECADAFSRGHFRFLPVIAVQGEREQNLPPRSLSATSSPASRNVSSSQVALTTGEGQVALSPQALLQRRPHTQT